MEVYKEISSSQGQEFKKLLLDNFSKTKIEEGKLLTGTVTKINEKYVYLLIQGMKSEALIDINEAKTVYGEGNIKENDKLEVYLEKIEDKNGEVIVSATRAQKIRGWYILEKAYEGNQNVKGKIVSIENDLVTIDVGLKSEGRIPINEFSRPGQKPELNIGDEAEVFIENVDNAFGETKLSREKAVKQKAWHNLQESFANNSVVTGIFF